MTDEKCEGCKGNDHDGHGCDCSNQINKPEESMLEGMGMGTKTLLLDHQYTHTNCDYCGGTGKVPHPADDGEEGDWTWVPCPKCRTVQFVTAIGAEVKDMRRRLDVAHEKIGGDKVNEVRETLGLSKADRGWPSTVEVAAKHDALDKWVREVLVGRIRKLEDRVVALEPGVVEPEDDEPTPVLVDLNLNRSIPRPSSMDVVDQAQDKPFHPLFDDPGWTWHNGCWMHETGAVVMQSRKGTKEWFATRVGDECDGKRGPFVDVEEAIAAALG